MKTYIMGLIGILYGILLSSSIWYISLYWKENDPISTISILLAIFGTIGFIILVGYLVFLALEDE